MGESTDSSGPQSATSSPAESKKGSEGAIVSADLDTSPIGEDHLKLERALQSAASITQLREPGAARTPASAKSAASSTVQESTIELSELKVLLAELMQDIKKSEKANEKTRVKASEKMRQELKQANEWLRQEFQQANERLHQEVQLELDRCWEWIKDLKTLVENCQSDNDQSMSDSDDEEDQDGEDSEGEMAKEKLTAVYGEEGPSKSYDELLNIKLEMLNSPKKTISAESVKELSKNINQYIRSDMDEETKSYWPLKMLGNEVTDHKDFIKVFTVSSEQFRNKRNPFLSEEETGLEKHLLEFYVNQIKKDVENYVTEVSGITSFLNVPQKNAKQELKGVVASLEKGIIDGKKRLYNSLDLSIQKELSPVYIDYNMEEKSRIVITKMHEKLQYLFNNEENETAFVSELKEKITNLKQKHLYEEMFIGIFGKTGTGKSSLINALLNEKTLLPTSSRKACTSCIIQVQVHENNRLVYKAEIEFISKEEWEEELKELIENCKQDHNEDSSYTEDGQEAESELAKEKIMAVYGKDGLNKSFFELANLKILDTLKGSKVFFSKTYISKCNSIWIVTDITRAESDRNALEILNTGLRGIAGGGECQNITYICTKTDEIGIQMGIQSCPSITVHTLSSDTSSDVTEPLSSSDDKMNLSSVKEIETDSETESYESEDEARYIISSVYEKLQVLSCSGNDDEFLNQLRKMTFTLSSNKIYDNLYVGIFGKTGAGKSSLINALLNEINLLPTSGQKACTSCIVEVKAHEDLFNETYKAEIEFISKEDWIKELKTLVECCQIDNDQDMSDSDDEDQDGEDSEGEMAKEKLTAVYGEEGPSKSYDELVNIKLEMFTPPKKTIEAESVKELSKNINHFIRSDMDSKTKSYWPLVKSVKLRVPRNPNLLDNVVLIDFPGIGDTNKDRNEMWKKGKTNMKTFKEMSGNLTKELQGLEKFFDSCSKNLEIELNKGVNTATTECLENAANILKPVYVIRKLKPEMEQYLKLALSQFPESLDLPGYKMEQESRNITSRMYEKVKDLSCTGTKEASFLAELKEKIVNLREKNIYEEIFIGIFGKTGTGKSSLINALLNEICLLPTSSRQACTSCIVQVQAHENNTQYRAEIEFISKEEWEEELKELVENCKEDEKDEDNNETDDGEDTESEKLPLLKEHLKVIHVNQTEKAVENYVSEVSGIISFLNVPKENAEEKADENEILYFKLSKKLKAEAGILANFFENTFKILQKELTKGVENAEKECIKNVRRLLKPEGLNHQTIKALCKNSGSFRSSKGDIIDLNNELALPIYAAVDNTIKNTFQDKVLNLKERHIHEEVFIGIFGMTGTGKSSLINALLNEINLLPTSSSKACTSCIVQVQAHENNALTYRAEIEFISKEEWDEELKEFLESCKDDNNHDNDDSDNGEDSEIENAKEKITAVYGKDGLTKSLSELTNKKIHDSLKSKFISKSTFLMGSEEHGVENTLKVFTVSSKEYWNITLKKKSSLTIDETELPSLKGYLREIYISQTKKTVENYISEVSGIISFLNVTKEYVGDKNNENTSLYINLTKKLKYEIHTLDVFFGKILQTLETELKNGVDKAEKDCLKNLNSLLKPEKMNFSGYHQTIKALCKNSGSFRSSRGDFIDLNNKLTSPIYATVNNTIKSTFQQPVALLSRNGGEEISITIPSPGHERAASLDCIRATGLELGSSALLGPVALTVPEPWTAALPPNPEVLPEEDPATCAVLPGTLTALLPHSGVLPKEDQSASGALPDAL
ncbi:SLIP GTPase, partial [Polypterus senegalus]